MQKDRDKIVLIGYSGHAYVVLDTLKANGRSIVHYLEKEEKKANPYGLKYSGPEAGREGQELLGQHPYFIAIGENDLRAKIDQVIKGTLASAIIHPKAIIADLTDIGDGTLVAAGAIVNPLAKIGRCAIINSGAIVEHECRVGDYAHVAPGATLLGNVSIGERTLIGGNAVVLPGVIIGPDCTVGAGAIVRKNVPAGTIVVGNPARKL